MWQPEHAAHGPEPATERDIAGLNRLFADAFTDRYRRDGLVGVRVPFLHAAIWRYAIADAGEGAMIWRDEQDKIVAFNIAHRSGSEGWMGPLAVRPDRQLGGLGKEIVRSAVEWLKRQGVTVLGLETMPRTVDNIGFYSRLGFVPGCLTLTMTREAQRGGRVAYEVLGMLDPHERAARLAEVTALAGALQAGVDFSREIQLTLDMLLGNVVTVRRDGGLAGFALCHTAPLAEGGNRDELRVLKIAATGTDVLLEVLDAVGAWAASQNSRRIAVRCLLRTDHRIRLDLDEHVGIHQRPDLHHRARRPDVAEHLAVRPAHLLPVADVGHVDAGTHHVAQPGPRALERPLDVVQCLHRLRVGVAPADDPAGFVGRRGAGHRHQVARPHRPRVADHRLPRRAARDREPARRLPLPRSCHCQGSPV